MVIAYIGLTRELGRRARVARGDHVYVDDLTAAKFISNY